MSYRVKLSRQVEDDLLRLLDFVIEREPNRPGGGHLLLADRPIAAIEDGFDTLRRSLFLCRKADQSPFLQERVISFGSTDFVALP